MRILQYSFFSLLFLFLSVFVVFVIAQEVLFFWGTISVQSALSNMKKAEVGQVCQAYLNQYSPDGISVGYQLRFNSDTEFVTEAYCKPFISNITTLSESTLPPFVTKIPGSSGIIYGVERSGLGITVFSAVYKFIEDNTSLNLNFLQKKKYISVENEVVISESDFTSYGQTPRSSCEGFGYTCCNSVTEEGIGNQTTNTTNCERSCFSSCQRRPSILSFMSDPFPDVETRTAIVSAGVPVEFQYLSDVDELSPGTALLDFGDGTSANGNGNSGSLQHIYSCAQARCEYTATLTISDENGRNSAMTVLSTLKIVVAN